MDPSSVNDLARQLLQSLPATVRGAQADLEHNFRAVLRAALARLDLVGREEFDVQTKVLERTRARLAQLEARLADLERGAHGSGGAG